MAVVTVFRREFVFGYRTKQDVFLSRREFADIAAAQAFANDQRNRGLKAVLVRMSTPAITAVVCREAL